ncbi:hypothetical protein F4677DRAFT_444077 [Hypoxylon crocopeplum]|nr:hypothetical protein F4677DRAFT_444077 [Hypoxylon crocopeplum]
MDRETPISQQANTAPEIKPQFRFFGRLPLEIRREIYIWATPTRVVQVKEDGYRSQDWYQRLQAFRVACKTGQIELKLHPDIAYFACNWRPLIGLFLRPRPQLTSGFNHDSGQTSQSYQPWVPTADTPEIPPSEPIPALLHVCCESREVLMNYGYQLSFGTRAHEARTWFNFDRDTLYLGYHEPSTRTLLSGAQWDVGLFRPADLIRIKKLALKGGHRAMGMWDVPLQTSYLLQLLPSLQDLLFVEWEPDVIEGWVKDSYSRQPGGSEQHHVCILIDEIDPIAKDTRYDFDQGIFTYSAVRGFKTRRLLSPVYEWATFFNDREKEFEERLMRESSSIAYMAGRTAARQWKLPYVQIVHMCSKAMADSVFEMRHLFWVRFLEAKHKLMQSRSSNGEASKEAVGTTSEHQGMGKAYMKAKESDEERLKGPNAEPELYTENELWWLRSRVCPPRSFIV